MQANRMKQFKDIEKIIQLQQHDLSQKLREIKNLITKKNQSITTMEHYLTDYEAKLNNINSMHVPNMQNFQAFIAQILKALNQEQELVEQLHLKRETIYKDYVQNENRLELIEKMLLKKN